MFRFDLSHSGGADHDTQSPVLIMLYCFRAGLSHSGGADQAERLPGEGVQEPVPAPVQPLPVRVHRRAGAAVPQERPSHRHHARGDPLPSLPAGDSSCCCFCDGGGVGEGNGVVDHEQRSGNSHRR